MNNELLTVHKELVKDAREVCKNIRVSINEIDRIIDKCDAYATTKSENTNDFEDKIKGIIEDYARWSREHSDLLTSLHQLIMNIMPNDDSKETTGNEQQEEDSLYMAQAALINAFKDTDDEEIDITPDNVEILNDED